MGTGLRVGIGKAPVGDGGVGQDGIPIATWLCNSCRRRPERRRWRARRCRPQRCCSRACRRRVARNNSPGRENQGSTQREETTIPTKFDHESGIGPKKPSSHRVHSPVWIADRHWRRPWFLLQRSLSHDRGANPFRRRGEHGAERVDSRPSLPRSACQSLRGGANRSIMCLQ